MWEQVLISLEQYRHQTIYVGCSGGVDSMTLVHFLHAHQFDIHLLHVNYHQRGNESDADMKLVKAVAEQYSDRPDGSDDRVCTNAGTKR